MRKPLDGKTFERAQTALADARRLGLDPVEYLHAQGLLASPALQQEIITETLTYVHRQLASWRPAEILRRKYDASRQTTPTDMYNCILEYVEEMISVVKTRKDQHHGL